MIMDDFRPSKELSFAFLLRLFDRYPMTVEGKRRGHGHKIPPNSVAIKVETRNNVTRPPPAIILMYEPNERVWVHYPNDVIQEILSEPDLRKRRQRVSIWNHFMQIDFYPIRIWPKNTARLATKIHLTNADRWKVFHFLVNNGMSPEMAAEEVLISETLGHTRYDTQAHGQMNQLMHTWEDYNRMPYWDMLTHQYVTPGGRS